MWTWVEGGRGNGRKGRKEGQGTTKPRDSVLETRCMMQNAKVELHARPGLLCGRQTTPAALAVWLLCAHMQVD